MSEPADTERREFIRKAGATTGAAALATAVAGQPVAAAQTIELNRMGPTPEQVQRFLALPDRPVVMVNLLKFKEGSGAEDYGKYGQAMQKILADIGAEIHLQRPVSDHPHRRRRVGRGGAGALSECTSAHRNGPVGGIPRGPRASCRGSGGTGQPRGVRAIEHRARSRCADDLDRILPAGSRGASERSALVPRRSQVQSAAAAESAISSMIWSVFPLTAPPLRKSRTNELIFSHSRCFTRFASIALSKPVCRRSM